MTKTPKSSKDRTTISTWEEPNTPTYWMVDHTSNRTTAHLVRTGSTDLSTTKPFWGVSAGECGFSAIGGWLLQLSYNKCKDCLKISEARKKEKDARPKVL